MAKIQFETGQTVEFSGTPTQQDVEDVARQLNIQQPQTQPKSIFKKAGEFLGDITGATGVIKGVGEAAKIAKAGLTGKPLPAPSISPTRFAGSAAKLGLTVASFGGIGAAGSLGAKALQTAGLGAGFAGAEAVEQGRVPRLGELATGAAVGGAIPVVGAGFGAIKRGIADTLPKSLIKTYFPTGEKNITDFILKNPKLGTARNMLDTAKNNVKNLSGQIDNILDEVSPDEVVNKKFLLNSVARSYGQTGGGGTLTGTAAEKVISRVVPEAKGLLSKETLTVKDANRLRKAIDLALGDRFFLVKHSPFTKEVAGTFNSFLRDTVKANAPKSVPVFDELSKEITLRNALNQTTKKLGRLNLRDIAAGLGGAIAGGPVGAIGTLAGVRAFQEPGVALGVARGLTRFGQTTIPETVKRVARFVTLRGATRK